MQMTRFPHASFLLWSGRGVAGSDRIQKTKEPWRHRRGDIEKYKEESKGENTLARTSFAPVCSLGDSNGPGRRQTVRRKLKGQ